MEFHIQNDVGLRIYQDIDRTSPAQMEQLRGAPASNVGDVMRRLYCMDASIRPFGVKQLLGPAFTVKVPLGDNLFIHRALDLAQPGDVLVVDGGGCMERALMGEIMFTYAQQRGLSGVVVNGCIRDCDSLTHLKIPVYAKGVTPQGPYKHGPGEINVPVSCGGMAILPGDVLVGDADSICVVRKNDLPKILEEVSEKRRAEEIQLKNYASSEIDFSSHSNAYSTKVDQLRVTYYKG